MTINIKMESENFLFSLNKEDIKNIPFQKYNKDFTFIVNGNPYKTNRIFADIISPKVRNLHFSDESTNEYHINTHKSSNTINKITEEEDYFQEFLNLSTFSIVELDFKRQQIYSEYFYHLGNMDEYYRIRPDYLKNLTIENAVDRLLSIIAL